VPLQSTACTAARHPVSSSHRKKLQLLKLGMQLRPLPGWRMDHAVTGDPAKAGPAACNHCSANPILKLNSEHPPHFFCACDQVCASHAGGEREAFTGCS
jgi:hypothetical protein